MLEADTQVVRTQPDDPRGQELRKLFLKCRVESQPRHPQLLAVRSPFRKRFKRQGSELAKGPDNCFLKNLFEHCLVTRERRLSQLRREVSDKQFEAMRPAEDVLYWVRPRITCISFRTEEVVDQIPGQVGEPDRHTLSSLVDKAVEAKVIFGVEFPARNDNVNPRRRQDTIY